MFKKISVALCGLAMIAGSLSAQGQSDKAKIADRFTAAGLVASHPIPQMVSVGYKMRPPPCNTGRLFSISS